MMVTLLVMFSNYSEKSGRKRQVRRLDTRRGFGAHCVLRRELLLAGDPSSIPVRRKSESSRASLYFGQFHIEVICIENRIHRATGHADFLYIY